MFRMACLIRSRTRRMLELTSARCWFCFPERYNERERGRWPQETNARTARANGSQVDQGLPVLCSVSSLED